MKCPYRIKEIKELNTTGISSRVDQIITEEFWPECIERQCPLYQDGKCVRAKREADKD